MFKSKQQVLHISIFLAIVMLVSACGGNMIKPIRKDVIGHSTVRNITVVALSSITSKTLTSKVKASVRKEATKELKGNQQVDLKISLNRWTGSEGGNVATTLLGSKTALGGDVEVLDTKTGAVIGKYSIFQQRKVGGLLDRTVVFFEVNKAVIDDFATYAVNELE